MQLGQWQKSQALAMVKKAVWQTPMRAQAALLQAKGKALNLKKAQWMTAVMNVDEALEKARFGSLQCRGSTSRTASASRKR